MTSYHLKTSTTMDIRQDDSLYTILSSLDPGTTLDEIDCSTDSSLNGTSLFYRNASLSATKSRGPPPPLPTTPKPKVAVTRSTVEDFLLLECSFRDSVETSLDRTTTDSCSDENNSMRTEDYGVPCPTLSHINQSDTNLKTFDRNSPMRIAKRRRHIQRCLPTILSADNRKPDSTPTSCPVVPRPLKVRLKRFIQRKIKKIFS